MYLQAACFLPKIFGNRSGNGSHCHFSIEQVQRSSHELSSYSSCGRPVLTLLFAQEWARN